MRGENLVLTIAKMIDPGAYAVWYSGTGVDAPPIEPSIRVKHARQQAECRAIAILKRLTSVGEPAIVEALIEFEMDGWRRLGVPVDAPELAKVVRRKYAAAACPICNASEPGYATPLQHLDEREP